MGTKDSSLPETLKDRDQLRASLIKGAASAPMVPVDTAYFEALRERAHNWQR
jgi:hypothetical protein